MAGNLFVSKSILNTAIFLVVISLFIKPAIASDHVDGQVTIDHPMADISDLFTFPSPNKPGHMVIVMNVYPFVPYDGHFAHQVKYQLAIRNLQPLQAGTNGVFKLKGETKYISCLFDTPHDEQHWATCKFPVNKQIKFKVDEVAENAADGIKVFAGRRADPFIFNSTWFAEIVKKGKLPKPGVSNNMSNLNALSIIVELDVKKVLGESASSLWAIAGETLTLDPGATTYRRIDRVGRPEVSNARLVNKNNSKDLRNMYNAADTFETDAAIYKEFRQRLFSNLAYFDNLDNRVDWSDSKRGLYADILLNDFLVLDMSKPFVIGSYFDIEMFILKGKAYNTPGGRVPGDVIIDKLFNNMINAGKSNDVTMGIPQATALPEANFPYVGDYHSNPIAWLLPGIARSAAEKLAMD